MSDDLLVGENLRRSFDGETVIASVSVRIRHGENLVVLGPSGCGKTTLINIIAGFDDSAEFDRLELDGRPVTGGGSEDIGVIFQEGSLFPWYTLSQNILFGREPRALDPNARRDLLERYLRRFGLDGLATKYPDQLSGGQRQRGAVARALINNPRLLLADEPFRALDSQSRLASQAFLWREISSRDQTLCLITHDIDEALLLGDRMLILSHRPTRVLGSFEIDLPRPRTPATVLSDGFHAEKQRFVDFCLREKLPLFPTEAA